MEIKSLTDEQLLSETHRLARAVSYYEAAESNWRQETAARNKTKAEFWEARKEMERREIVFENKGYLL
jgi:hypothetical protein